MTFNLKQIREDEKMTQEELSQKADVSRTIIAGLESGAIETTTTKTLTKIAKALNRKVSEIFLDK